jgi:putative ABC transport system permease protein
VSATRITGTTSDFLPELRLGFENLRAHKLRSLLTMLGMIFGVAAVVAMLSIGAGAQQEVMAFIEQLGVRNLIVEAREAPDQQTLQKIRKLSAGLSFKDFRMIEANLEGVTASSPRKRFTPSKLLPRPQADSPMLYGVTPGYVAIANLQLVRGRFFDEAETAAPRRWRCSAKRPRPRCSAPTIRWGST